jgi:photosystem II stability/assembly factor-like uncharacterized protein
VNAATGGWTTHGPWGNVNTIAIAPSDPAILYAGTFTGGVFRTTTGGRWWYAADGGIAPDTLIYALAVDPFDPQTVYAGTDTGAYKTTDGGGTWGPIDTGLTYPVVYALAIGPSDSQTIYAGTGASPGQVVFKSTDGGAMWTNVSGGIRSELVWSLAIDPSDPNVVYAGTNRAGPVYKTTNGGTTWSMASTGIPRDEVITDLAIDASSPTTVYAAASALLESAGIFKTTDGGETWIHVNHGLTSGWAYDLAIVPAKPSTLYAASDGVYKSTDGGKSWALQFAIPNSGGPRLAIDPIDPANLYLGVYLAQAGPQPTAYRSNDGGLTWRSMITGLAGGGALALALDPADPAVVFVGGDGAFFRTGGGGRHWQAHDRGFALTPAS